MSSKWARPCPLRALENSETEHWDYAQEKQWKLTCTPRIFFSLSLDFFYEHTEKLHTIFFYSLLVFLEQWMPKKSYFDREDKSDGNPLVHQRIFFFFHKNFPMNIQNDSLQASGILQLFSEHAIILAGNRNIFSLDRNFCCEHGGGG